MYTLIHKRSVLDMTITCAKAQKQFQNKIQNFAFCTLGWL